MFAYTDLKMESLYVVNADYKNAALLGSSLCFRHRENVLFYVRYLLIGVTVTVIGHSFSNKCTLTNYFMKDLKDFGRRIGQIWNIALRPMTPDTVL